MGLIKIQYFDSLYGELVLGSYDGKLCLCDWRYRKKRASIDSRIKAGPKAEFTAQDDIVTQDARRQLNEYFNHKRKTFDIPLLTVGSVFQKNVWNCLLKIPFGKTASYSQLAEDAGNRKAVRAVASANGANALSIFIPCHRIIGSNGDLAGYAGGIKVKANLLSLECDLFS
jgi:methylated-DNA-[protein]-cysteine S-methyltransferase